MKRTVNKYDVRKHYGLFLWQRCFFCEKEFRREDGYSFMLHMRPIFSYSCEDCCCSVSHCHDRIVHFFETARSRTEKILPPPPPMRTYRKHV